VISCLVLIGLRVSLGAQSLLYLEIPGDIQLPALSVSTSMLDRQADQLISRSTQREHIRSDGTLDCSILIDPLSSTSSSSSMSMSSRLAVSDSEMSSSSDVPVLSSSAPVDADGSFSSSSSLSAELVPFCSSSVASG
jgi:hypothetical protein